MASFSSSLLQRTCRARKQIKEGEREKRGLKCYTSAAGAIVFWGTGAIAFRTFRFRTLSCNALTGSFTFVNRIMLITRVYIFFSHYTVLANLIARDTATPLSHRICIKNYRTLSLLCLFPLM